MHKESLRERISHIAHERRANLGWALGDLGNGIARLGRKVCDEVPTVDDGDEWFEMGADYGHRVGSRVYTELGPTFEAMRTGASLTDEDMADRTGLTVTRIRAMQVPTEPVTEAERSAWIRAIVGTFQAVSA